MGMQATVKVPGSCGELVQGSIGGQNFLISCPINRYSRVTVYLDSAYQGVKVNRYAPKTVQALKKTLEFYRRSELGARVNISSELLVGKGMASSTADITGAVAAVMVALGYSIDIGLIKEIALEIEPTDGTFLAGLHLFDHREGKIERYLGEPPLLDILVFTEKGEVNSIDFNQRKDLAYLNSNKEGLVCQALEMVERGIRENDPLLLGKGATLSSRAHQAILYKKGLAAVLEMIAGEDTIFGVNIAHSGTLMGILVAKYYSGWDLISKISHTVPRIEYLGRVTMTAGGLEKEEINRDGALPRG